MKIKLLEKKYYQQYEAFLLSFNESLLYYSINYKKLLEELLNLKSSYLLAIDEDEKIQAILPYIQKEGYHGIVINTLPYFGSHGEIIAKSNEAHNALIKYYIELQKTACATTYISHPMINSSINPPYDIIDKRIGQWTKLNYEDNHEENILNSYESSTRRNIRKAIKSGVSIVENNDAIEFLYETHYKNISVLNGKTKEKKFFSLLEKHFIKGKDYKIFVATYKGMKIGALLIFYYNKTVEYFTPAVVNEYRSLQALPLIIFKAMTQASQNQYKWWNWGGTWSSQEGVYRFKKKFGTIEKPYYYYIKINNDKIYHSSKAELLKEYNDFYVIPFERLSKKEIL